jgi:hypothetical protein
LSTLFGGNFNSSYFDRTLQIGKAHARIGLDPHWYIGGYAKMLVQFVNTLANDESLERHLDKIYTGDRSYITSEDGALKHFRTSKPCCDATAVRGDPRTTRRTVTFGAEVVAGTLLFLHRAAVHFTEMRIWITSVFDWFFMIAANVVVLFCLGVAASPLGQIRLGGPAAQPRMTRDIDIVISLVESVCRKIVGIFQGDYHACRRCSRCCEAAYDVQHRTL